MVRRVSRTYVGLDSLNRVHGGHAGLGAGRSEVIARVKENGEGDESTTQGMGEKSGVIDTFRGNGRPYPLRRRSGAAAAAELRTGAVAVTVCCGGLIGGYSWEE